MLETLKLLIGINNLNLSIAGKLPNGKYEIEQLYAIIYLIIFWWMVYSHVNDISCNWNFYVNPLFFFGLIVRKDYYSPSSVHATVTTFCEYRKRKTDDQLWKSRYTAFIIYLLYNYLDIGFVICKTVFLFIYFIFHISKNEWTDCLISFLVHFNFFYLLSNKCKVLFF